MRIRTMHRQLVVAVALMAMAADVCHCQVGDTELSKAIIIEELQKLQMAVSKLEKEFDRMENKFFWNVREVADGWFEEGRKREANELMNYAQVMTLIEMIKYAVGIKTLKMTQQMLGGQFIPLASGSVDTGNGIVLPAQMVSILAARAIARARIEGERQSRDSWNLLYKLIEHHLEAYPDEPMFRKLAFDAFKQFQNSRSMELKLQESYFALRMKIFEQLNISVVDGSKLVNGLDLLLENAMGCPKCHLEFMSHEYFNTRPLFTNDNAVGEALDQIIDPDLWNEFESFDNDPKVYHVSLEDQNKVTKKQIHALMTKVLSEGKPKRRWRKMRKD